MSGGEVRSKGEVFVEKDSSGEGERVIFRDGR